MLPLTLLLAAPLALCAPTATPLLETQTALAPLYRYAVHVPANVANPPAVLFLHGSGSMAGVDELTTNTLWDGIGLRIAQYGGGNLSEANTLAGEQFLAILPLEPNVTASGAPSTTSWIDWQPDRVMAVLADAQSRYTFNTSRVFLAGYSIGGHGVWNVLAASDTTPFRAAVISAAEPDPSLISSQSLFASLPIRHYCGTADTHAPLAGCQAVQAALTARGNSNASLLTVDGADHGTMHDQPFDADMLKWLLSF